MKYYAPQIAWHDRKSLYSIDVDANLVKNDSESTVYRLATGGSDSRINIWHIKILDIPDLDKKKPVEQIECVAELTQHQRSVNVVRFSPKVSASTTELTQYLASGDDDALIYIWKLCNDEEESLNKSTTPTNEFEEEVISIETWKIHKTLRGHSKDICDLAWSASAEFIVSGGVDNLVFVWDVVKGTKVHKLQKEHSSYVLGVAYDPFERYIASISNDRSLMIFNAKNGKTLQHIDRMIQENENDETGEVVDCMIIDNNSDIQNNDSNSSSKPVNFKKSLKLFHDQTMMSFSRRLTFTPGGEFLIVPSGIIEKENDEIGNVLYVFSRESLDRPSFYLPTQKFSLSVRCCPVLFELRKENSSNIMNLPYRIIFASATEDAVYFYDSQQAAPFAYVSQIHYLRLTDISWSYDGRFLMVTSSDGFTSFIIFDQGELGIPYHGPRLTLEQLEPIPLSNISKKSKKVRESKPKEEKENKDKITSPVRRKSEKNKTPISVRQDSASKSSTSKKSEKISTSPKSHNITKFFNKIGSASSSSELNTSQSPSSSFSPHITATLPTKENTNLDRTPKTGNMKQETNIKSARRVSLITLFAGNKNVSKAPAPSSTNVSLSIDKPKDIDCDSNHSDSVQFIEERPGIKRKLDETKIIS